jgi:hypothetical protein
MTFDESNNPPNGTAPEDAFVPPGNTQAEKVANCLDVLRRADPVLGPKCREWLKEVNR